MSDARHRMAMSPGTRGVRGTRGEKDPPRDAVSGPEPEPAVAFDNGVESFGRGPGAMQPLRDVSFYIRDNEFPTLLGPSGCRKTAQLRALTGFEHATCRRDPPVRPGHPGCSGLQAPGEHRLPAPFAVPACDCHQQRGLRAQAPACERRGRPPALPASGVRVRPGCGPGGTCGLMQSAVPAHFRTNTTAGLRSGACTALATRPAAIFRAQPGNVPPGTTGKDTG